MPRYSHLYAEEEAAHQRTRERLVVANDLVASFRDFIQAKRMQGEFLEFIIARHLGEDEAKRILGTDEQGNKTT